MCHFLLNNLLCVSPSLKSLDINWSQTYDSLLIHFSHPFHDFEKWKCVKLCKKIFLSFQKNCVNHVKKLFSLIIMWKLLYWCIIEIDDNFFGKIKVTEKNHSFFMEGFVRRSKKVAKFDEIKTKQNQNKNMWNLLLLNNL